MKRGNSLRNMYPPSIQKLIDLFSEFPTVGPRTAARFVFYLLKAKKEDVEELVKSIDDLKKSIKLCSFCFNPFDVSKNLVKEELCDICRNQTRDRTLLCVVEKESDLISIEKIKKYKGLYFILGGAAPLFLKGGVKKLRIEELHQRIKSHPEIKEIIIATNPTTEGGAAALYLERFLKPFNKKITRLGRGLPVGGELEYADEETLSSALEGRK